MESRVGGRRGASIFALCGMLAALIVAVIPSPAMATDDSKKVDDCTLYARDPVPNYEQNYVTAFGNVTCNQRHVLSMTVFLEIYRGERP